VMLTAGCLEEEIPTVGVSYDTLVSMEDDNWVITFDHVSYNPQSSSLKLFLDRTSLVLGSFPEEDMPLEKGRSRGITDNVDSFKCLFSDIDGKTADNGVTFQDNDGNEYLSTGDVITVPGSVVNKLNSKTFDIDTPEHHVYGEGVYGGDQFVVEDPEALKVIKVTTDPEKPKKLDGMKVEVEVYCENKLERESFSITDVGNGGMSSYGQQMKKKSQDGNTYVFSVTIDDDGGLMMEDSSHDNFYFYFLFKDDQSNERVYPYKMYL